MRRMKQRVLLAWPWLWLWLFAATAGSPSSDTFVSTTFSSSASSGSISSSSSVTKPFSLIIPTSTSSSVQEDLAFPLNQDFRFTQPLYNVSIPENSIGKTYVVPEQRMGIKLASHDINLDVRFRIMSGDRDKFFKAEERTVGDFCFLLIRTRTGNVDVLNRERKDRYVLEVRASISNGNGKSRSSTVLEADTTVVVTVLDTNDLNPLFYPTEYEATITEDTPLHRNILRVIAEDADLGRNGEIYYSFAEETDQFAVHPVSGVITLTRPLRYSERATHELMVLAKDRGALFRSGGSSRPSTAKVTIRVRQVNLHSPEIYVHHLPDIVEHSNADIYAIVRVVDQDEGVHGQIASLDIVGGDPAGHFRVRSAGGSHSGEYNIEVLHLLDRETAVQGYNLTLRAMDRGVPQRFSYKFVPVHLADLNDNAPVFSREIYEVKVPETAPINTPVIRLKVTDADEGRNALVFLEIVGGNEGGEFYVNAETGVLYTSASLDAEKKAFYTLTVSAVDQGNAGTRKQSSAKVKINVVDTNDNDPTFEQSEMEVWIDENEPAGTSVVKITAKDRDSGENAYISYSIDNIQKVPFEIDHFSGIVRTRQVLDYETMKREYLLHVRVSDWGLPYRRQAEMQLHVKVRDVNDNRPQFERIECTGHVPRYLPIGSEVITVSAIDFDAGNTISYRIVSGNEDGCFALDSASGVLSVACDLSDVKSTERMVNVTATDDTHFADVNPVHMHLVNAKRNLGSPGRILSDQGGAFECRDTGVARRLTEAMASAERNNIPSKDDEYTLTPSRYGENIHTPEFIDFPSEIKVNESAKVGTTLVRIRARDRDLDYNGKLVFCISGGDRDSVFGVDPDTGDLNVIGYLDRERESEYFLNISVYDLGRPQKSSSRMLPVTILDVNDNAPKFERSLASFRISETALNGTNVWRANATDADLGENARVTYSLVTETNDFRVDPVTGVLSVFGRLDRERQEIYELRIRAQDNGGKGSDTPPLYSDALVRVTVDDVNDNAPVFALSSYTVKIREDVPVWTVVAVVDATDPDEGAGGDIEYFLSDAMESEGYFKVDKVSGTIRTTQSLDFEMVIIEVVDVNENLHPPVFDDFVVSASVFENQPVGTLVTTVRAKDADPLGGDSRIGYTIRDGDGIGIFSIDNEAMLTPNGIQRRSPENISARL
ncbi:PREDICTED: fat-like cadherin-related tumor suppressor homolog [Dufourea novaeangliae]|uniref:fat-like cadherin-related tumor suppressor homolog n=1 Tax=Dufourea novaeangliae TaxID=178035 RepID=UPI000767B1A9|nr:PREDICTED: fat-like cadherin-related tumor suppressor homolog [Dufourea novaeangliae]